MISSVWRAAQIQGGRKYQEDFFAVVENNRLYYKGREQLLSTGRMPAHLSLFLLTDGMGGMGHGDLAADTTIAAFVEAFLEQVHKPQSLQSCLQQSTQLANDTIAHLVTESPDLKGMGCTLVCLLWNNLNQEAEWLSVGDSLLYLFRADGWHKLNQAHTLGWLAQTRSIEELPVSVDELAGMEGLLCSAIDGSPISHIDHSAQPLRIASGDILVIASDGLITLDSKEIEQIISPSTTEIRTATHEAIEQQLAARLQHLFDQLAHYGRPNQDNTTIILIGFADVDAEPSPQQDDVTLRH